MQTEERSSYTTMAEVLTSSGDASVHVEPVDSLLPDKEAPAQEEGRTPFTTMPKTSTSGADTSIPVKPAGSPPYGREAAE